MYSNNSSLGFSFLPGYNDQPGLISSMGSIRPPSPPRPRPPRPPITVLERFVVHQQITSLTPRQIQQLKECERNAICTPFQNIINPCTTSCSILCDDFGEDEYVVVVKHCNHIYNKDALKEWLKFRSTCPMCRHNLRVSTDNTVQLTDPTNIRENYFEL